MATINLLYKNQYAINDKIHVVIPTVGQILENEDGYYNMISIFTSMPIDLMLELEEVGVDFTTINDYELFLILFNSLRTMDTSLVLGDLDLSKFQMATNEQNGKLVLYDAENDICIDRAVHGQIAATLREIHHLEKNRRKPANEEAKQYLLERARIKAKRRKNRKEFSDLESLIVAMVCTEQFKYNFEQTKELTIYQFNEAVQQIVKKVDYEHKMHGVYAGTVDPKGLSQYDLNWLSHRK